MITDMPGTANLTNTTTIAPKPGDNGWIDEAGKDIARVIAVEGDRAFFVHAARSYWDQDAQEWVMKEGIPTSQVWTRWRRKSIEYRVQIRPALVGELVIIGGANRLQIQKQDYDTSNAMVVVVGEEFV